MDSTTNLGGLQSLSSFLDFPTEIRLNVYHFALQYACGDNKSFYNLTLTCRKVRDEAFPIIITASEHGTWNLSDFLRWVKNGHEKHLALVRKVALDFDEKCYMTIAEAPLQLRDPSIFPTDTPLFWEARYGQIYPEHPQPILAYAMGFPDTLGVDIISLIWESLRSIPNTTVLRLKFNPLYQGFSHEFQPEQRIVLEMLSAAFPNLLRLHVFSEFNPLDYLRGFPNLRHLEFTGLSSSTPTQALSTLQSLKSLEGLSFQGRWSRSMRGSYPEPGSRISFTPEVLSQLRPLKYFQTVDFSIPIINALRAHSNSLQYLEIRARNYRRLHVDKELIIEILDFAGTSPIPNITIEFIVPEDLATLNIKSLIPKSNKEVDVILVTDPDPKDHTQLLSYLKVRAGVFLIKNAKNLEE